ncbi:MAG: putative two-component system response regulator [Frankiales bacterium]|nr:putative two-component system response regulator [Frankiales bacterium]
MSLERSSTAEAPLRVVVADDHPIWRDAVERDLTAAGLSVVGTAGDGAKAVRVCAAVRPDVLVCDLQMPGLTGVEVARAVAPEVRVLVLSASGEQADVLEAVKAGATGYLVKSASTAELVDAVRRTAAGESVLSPGLAGLLLGEFRRTADDDGAPQLTARETEVLRLVAKGLTARQAAERLGLSHRTVENHVQNTLGKLQLHNRAQLVRYAVERGLAGGD